jgi:hypothetical protein
MNPAMYLRAGDERNPGSQGEATGATKNNHACRGQEQPSRRQNKSRRPTKAKGGKGRRRALARNRVINFAQTYQVRRSSIAAVRSASQEAAMDRLAEMVQYVRQKNIDRIRKLLDEPTDPLRRQQLQQQLAELEAAQQ